MRYGVAIPHANRFASGPALDRMAAIVEDLGFDSLWTSDHIIVPEGSGYIPEHMLEPLAALSYLAARTTHVTLGVSVLVIPYRDPVFTAKHLSTIDVLSGGRLVLGVGIGWLKEEFDALGASYDERAAQTDEYLEVIRNLWETETSSYDGRWKHYDNMRMFPKGAPESTRHHPDLGGRQHRPRAPACRSPRRRLASHQHEPRGARGRRQRLPSCLCGGGSHPWSGLPAPHAQPARRRCPPGAHRQPRRAGERHSRVRGGRPRRAHAVDAMAIARPARRRAARLHARRRPTRVARGARPQPGRIVMLMRGPTSDAGETFGTQ